MTARSNRVAAATGLRRKMKVADLIGAVLAMVAAGTVAARDAAAARVYVALAEYKAAVQKVADADPVNAGTIIVRSGLRTRRESTRRKVLLGAKRGRVSRSLDVDVKSVAKRASYEWENSLDGGETWIRVRTTTETKTTIPDLPLGKLVQIRCRPVTKSGPGEWIGPITVRVT